MHEIKITTSDCAQTFFKQDDKNGSRDPLANKNFQLHQVGVELENSLHWKKSPKVLMAQPSVGCGMAQGYLELRNAKLNFDCDNSTAIVLKQIYATNIHLGLC